MRRLVVYFSGFDSTGQKARDFLSGLDENEFDIEYVDLSADKKRLFEAQSKGIKALPSILINERPCYFNVEMSLAEFKRMLYTVADKEH